MDKLPTELDELYFTQILEIEKLHNENKITALGKMYMQIVASSDLFTRLSGKQINYDVAKETALGWKNVNNP